MANTVLNQMITYFGTDIRRINHAIKVYGFANSISSGESLNDNEKLIIELSAILHDIGIKEAERKYNSHAGHYQELEGPAVAREIMLQCGVSNEIIERVCYIIGNHHTYTKIDGVDFQILVEADFFVNIDEDQMSFKMVESIREKYFKTKTGIQLLTSIYFKNIK